MTHDNEDSPRARTAEAIAMNLKLAACPTCNGTGKVDGVRVEWIRAGEQMRLKRERLGLSIEDEGRRRCMSAYVLTQMELGLVQPVPAEDLGL